MEERCKTLCPKQGSGKLAEKMVMILPEIRDPVARKAPASAKELPHDGDKVSLGEAV